MLPRCEHWIFLRLSNCRVKNCPSMKCRRCFGFVKALRLREVLLYLASWIGRLLFLLSPTKGDRVNFCLWDGCLLLRAFLKISEATQIFGLLFHFTNYVLKITCFLIPTYQHFLKISEAAQIFCLLFSLYKLCINVREDPCSNPARV
jgi:hypothetical protein